jgi:hypothetical protein
MDVRHCTELEEPNVLASDRSDRWIGRGGRMTVPLVVLACVLLAFLSAARCTAQPIAGAAPVLIAPREYLQIFGIDERALAVLDDGRPLDEAQRDQVLSILFRLRQYPLAALEHFAKTPTALATIAEHPADARGHLFKLVGRVTHVVREELNDEQRQRFQVEAVFRCTLVTATGQRAVVLVLAVPSAWKLDQPIDEPASALAMFLKALPPQPSAPDDKAAEAAEDATGEPGGAKADAKPPGAAEALLLFAAPRVAWHPDTPLGRLGMDLGLFDQVRDRTGLDERECFYQLLAAAGRADPAALAREARAQLASRSEAWRREADDRNLDPARRNAARRALERAKDGASDVAPLFNEPAAQRGALVTLRGAALRAIEVRVEDPDIVSRFDIHRYYEVEILTADSQNNPIVCCVLELPEGFPLGDDIHVGVRVTGFFLKSWAYGLGPDAGDPGRRQLAPLIVAPTLSWIPEPAKGGQSLTLAVLLALSLAVAVAVLWYLRRGDRRALADAQAARLWPERISLDEEEPL